MATLPGDAERRRADRARWPVLRLLLTDDSPDDLSDVTTPTERVGMMWGLAETAWKLAGKPWPSYDRRDIPARLFRPGECPPDDDES